MGQDSRGVMKVRLIEQLIELNAVLKPSRREFKSWSWYIYIRIIVLFISLLAVFFFFKFFAIYVLNILEYMTRQQQSGKTALICCRMRRLIWAHAKGNIFSRHGSKLVIKTEGVHQYYFFTFLRWVSHVCDRTLCAVYFLLILHQQNNSICLWKKNGFVSSKIGRFAQLSNILLVIGCKRFKFASLYVYHLASARV